MKRNANDILNEALGLSETDRRWLMERIRESISDEGASLSAEDPDLIEELDRRFNDLDGLVSADKLWESSL